MFRLFQDAWAVLSDASRRAAYDLELGKGIEIEPTLNTQEIYRLLHLDPTADEVIVSVAYKILTARYGPDNADTEDPEMFEKLVNAWRSYRYGDSWTIKFLSILPLHLPKPAFYSVYTPTNTTFWDCPLGKGFPG